MHAGNCQCGSVVYELNGDPLTCYACHCNGCQSATGSAFALSMLVASSELEIKSGTVADNAYSHNGNELTRHHCSKCGSALWFSAGTDSDVVALKPGTLQDKSWFKPVAHCWLQSAQPWLVVDDGAQRYQTQPEIAELISLWQQRHG